MARYSKIYLPLAGDASDAVESPVEAMALAAGGESVLLVEDEEQVRRLTRTILERYGYKVLEASSGAQALEVAASFTGPIHLLLTDVVMPGASGSDLAREIAKARPGIHVLYMSGYTDSSVIKNLILSPGTPFLQKPFTSDGLYRKIREILG